MPSDGPGLIASRLTPAGRGAVATIRISGDFRSQENRATRNQLDALFQAANDLPLCDQPARKIAFGRWGREDAEDLVVCRVDANTIEIHCHGGEAAVQRILSELAARGCEIVDWNESVQRTQGLLNAECLGALSLASTWRTTQIVVEQSDGLLQRAFERLLALCVINPDETTTALDQLLRWANFGLHLTTPWSVVLTGRPNVGKSSLINALVGYERAIVFDQPGTTRDIVTAETALEGWPITLADTAGLRIAVNPLEAAGIQRAHEMLRTADLRIVLIDVSQPATKEDLNLISQWPDAIVVAHKADLENRWDGQFLDGAISVSSVTKQGIAELQTQIVLQLIPEVPPPGTAIPLNARHINCLEDARFAPSNAARQDALMRLIESTRS